MAGRCLHPGAIGRAMNRGIGACFAEVEVDTWTGDWRYVNAAYAQDAGHRHEPAAGQRRSAWVVGAEHADGNGRAFRGTGNFRERGTTASAICRTGCRRSWSRRSRPTYSSTAWSRAGSLAPRASRRRRIGAAPGALANAIYNACGVRIREHPITKDKIMAGLRAKGKGGDRMKSDIGISTNER